MKTTPQASISIEKAAEMLNITPEELERFCQQDTGQQFHHLTIFSKKIRFWNRDIIRIRKHLSIKPLQNGKANITHATTTE
jgi:AraC-like DNA-binding protein